MRRLPVIQQAASDDAAAAARPRWHWLLIGAGLTTTIWVPLSVAAAPLGTAIAARAMGLARDDVVSGAAALSARDRMVLAALSAAPLLISFATASGLAGMLVGRFGGHAGRREAALGGILAAAFAGIVGAVGGSGLPPLGMLLAGGALAGVGALFGFLGAGFGVRKRPC